jgi:hypothetical protein
MFLGVPEMRHAGDFAEFAEVQGGVSAPAAAGVAMNDVEE